MTMRQVSAGLLCQEHYVQHFFLRPCATSMRPLRRVNHCRSRPTRTARVNGSAANYDGGNEEHPGMQLPGPGMSPDFRHYQTAIPTSFPNITSPVHLSHIDHDASYITTRCRCPSPPIISPPPTRDLSDLSNFLTFQHSVQLPDEAVDPLLCSMMIARSSQEFSVPEYQGVIHDMGNMVVQRVGQHSTIHKKMAAVNFVLYDFYGFNVASSSCTEGDGHLPHSPSTRANRRTAAEAEAAAEAPSASSGSSNSSSSSSSSSISRGSRPSVEQNGGTEGLFPRGHTSRHPSGVGRGCSGNAHTTHTKDRAGGEGAIMHRLSSIDDTDSIRRCQGFPGRDARQVSRSSSSSSRSGGSGAGRTCNQEDAMHAACFGSSHSLHQPDVHFLNQVIDKRHGSPTAMAIMYMALADRVGLRLQPVLLRSHVYLCAGGKHCTHVLDPYLQGRLRTRADVAADLASNKVYVAGYLGAETAGGPQSTPWPLGGRKELVLRLLLNLREVYWGPILRQQGGGPVSVQKRWQVQRALGLLRFARAASGQHPGLICDEGLALVLLDRAVEGLPLLSRFLHQCPDSAHAGMVQRLLLHFSRGDPGPPLTP